MQYVSTAPANRSFGDLRPLNDRHRHPFLGKCRVNAEHSLGLLDRLLSRSRGPCGLPARGTRPCAGIAASAFPSGRRCTTVDQQRQVAPRLDPVLVCVPDDRFGGRPNDQLLFELRVRIDDQALPSGFGFEAVMGDDGAFLGKALGVLLFLFEKRFGDEKREVGVLVPGRLEHIVQGPLHLFPDRIAVRLDDHAAADGGVLGQVGPL